MEATAEVETVVCKGCEAEIDYDNDWYDIGTDGEPYCDECHRSDLDSAPTVIFFSPDEGQQKVLVGEHFIVDGEYYEEWCGVNVTSEWVSTSGWHGHSMTKIEGYVEVESGWTTGWTDHTTSRKGDFNSWVENELPNCPIPVALILDRTSNIFSMGIGIAVPEGMTDAFNEWLGEEMVEDLHRWLG
jgi:hypothetical protein